MDILQSLGGVHVSPQLLTALAKQCGCNPDKLVQELGISMSASADPNSYAYGKAIKDLSVMNLTDFIVTLLQVCSVTASLVRAQLLSPVSGLPDAVATSLDDALDAIEVQSEIKDNPFVKTKLV